MARIEYARDAPTVLEAARHRVAQVFDEFEHIVISVSSGKDSTALRHLALVEARRRSRRCTLFFLDQEAEYQSTVDLITEWMTGPDITPEWYQVPIQMTNATSHRDEWLYAWEPGAPWLYDKHEAAIREIGEKYPQRFYKFFQWREQQCREKTAFLVGVRARESFNRFRAVTKSAGYRDWAWSTKTNNAQAFRVYPIYDWTAGDVWKFIADDGLSYNRYYDRMYARHGNNSVTMRVSNLLHEKAYKCLADLQEFEPDTYERLLKRLSGIHCAALYARDSLVYSADKLPESFPTWRAYRDYLLATTPMARAQRFRKRFSGQDEDEKTCRDQVKQVLINDWENNVPVTNHKLSKLRDLWWDKL
jgi:predicted phosphoadenosine phosphosulfate sulfurtransferase